MHEAWNALMDMLGLDPDNERALIYMTILAAIGVTAWIYGDYPGDGSGG